MFFAGASMSVYAELWAWGKPRFTVASIRLALCKHVVYKGEIVVCIALLMPFAKRNPKLIIGIMFVGFHFASKYARGIPFWNSTRSPNVRFWKLQNFYFEFVNFLESRRLFVDVGFFLKSFDFCSKYDLYFKIPTFNYGRGNQFWKSCFSILLFTFVLVT